MSSNSTADLHTAEQQKFHLQSLVEHPGFKILCERVNEKRRQELDEVIFDLKTGDEEARVLRKARSFLTGQFNIESIAAALLRTAENAVKREKQKPKNS